jgi:hypothetical protein
MTQTIPDEAWKFFDAHALPEPLATLSIATALACRSILRGGRARSGAADL